MLLVLLASIPTALATGDTGELALSATGTTGDTSDTSDTGTSATAPTTDAGGTGAAAVPVPSAVSLAGESGGCRCAQAQPTHAGWLTLLLLMRRR